MFRMLLLLYSIFFTSMIWANCSELVAKLAKQLHPKATLGPSHQNSCKIWPYSPDKTLVIMTFLSAIPDQEPDNLTYDMDVVVINNKNNEIISHLYEEKAFYNDAVFTDSVIIDTARYRLNSTTRAFGVRFTKRNMSQPNRYWGEILNLYYLKNKKLHQAVRGLSMNESYSDLNNECSGTFKDIQRSLIIDKGQNKAFNNLKVSETITNSELKTIKPKECDTATVNVKKQSLILKYNGSKYDVPREYIGDGFFVETTLDSPEGKCGETAFMVQRIFSLTDKPTFKLYYKTNDNKTKLLYPVRAEWLDVMCVTAKNMHPYLLLQERCSGSVCTDEGQFRVIDPYTKKIIIDIQPFPTQDLDKLEDTGGNTASRIAVSEYDFKNQELVEKFLGKPLPIVRNDKNKFCCDEKFNSLY